MKFKHLAFALGLFGATAAQAETYPARPITMVAAYAAGGITDVIARLVSKLLAEETGATVVVENRPGAGGILGTESVAKAKADGYTVLYATGGPFLIQPHMSKDPLGYDPLNDFIHIRGGAMGSQVFVATMNAPYNTIGELVAYAKEHPEEVNFGSPGVGTAQHIATEFLMLASGIEMTHIPYKAGSSQIVDMIAGAIDISAEYGTVVQPHVEGGKLKVLGSTGTAREALYPEAQTVVEAGYPDAVNVGLGWVALPKGTDPEVVTYLSEALDRVFNRPEWQAYLQANSQQGLGHMGPAELPAFIAEQSAAYKRAIEAAGLAPN